MIDTYAIRFRKIISKAEIVNLLSAQMQIMDFIAGLQIDLAIITNGSNLIDLDKAEKMAKNVKSASFINKNVMVSSNKSSSDGSKGAKSLNFEIKSKV